jgi:hypothetical protein
MHATAKILASLTMVAGAAAVGVTDSVAGAVAVPSL